jgi:hypothetical protein
MAVAAPIFYTDVADVINVVAVFACVVVELIAFVNCLTQRPDAFPVVGSISKAAWLGILGGSVLVTMLCGIISFFGLIAVAAAAVYLLDVRPALRDATDGTGSW